jgi:hypothetical protein
MRVRWQLAIALDRALGAVKVKRRRKPLGNVMREGASEARKRKLKIETASARSIVPSEWRRRGGRGNTAEACSAGSYTARKNPDLADIPCLDVVHGPVRQFDNDELPADKRGLRVTNNEFLSSVGQDF